MWELFLFKLCRNKSAPFDPKMSELDPGDKASPSREAVPEAAGSETEELLVAGTSTGGLSTGGAVGLSTGSDSGARSVTTSDILESPDSTVGGGGSRARPQSPAI